MRIRGASACWLIALSDPDGPPARPPVSQLQPGQCLALVNAADGHGVLAAFQQNLRAVAAETTVPPPLGTSPTEVQAALEEAANRIVRRTGRSMLLRGQLHEIGLALSRKGLRAAVLKGPQFAQRLYADAVLRTFADIDLLVLESQAESVAEVFAALGYTGKSEAGRKYDAGYGEQTWRRSDAPGGPVEVHWNLVNSPTVRQGVSVRFEDIQFEPPANGGSALQEPSPASMLLIAAVHGAASHSFDRLQTLWDICQIARRFSDTIDIAWLGETCRRTGATFSVATALEFAGALLGEPACIELRHRIGLARPNWFWRWVISPSVILNSRAGMSKARQNLYRQRLKKR